MTESGTPRCGSCGREVDRLYVPCAHCGADPTSGTPAPPTPRTGSAAQKKRRHYPLESVALLLQLLLGLFAAASLLAFFTAIAYRADVLDVISGAKQITADVVLTEDRYNTAALLVSGAYAVTSVVFIVWFWRAYSNITYFERVRTRGTGWAIGGWLIPFAGWVIPYGIGAEIWTQSRPEPGPVPERRDPNMEPVISWWALFLIMTAVNLVAISSLPVDATSEQLASFVGVDIVDSAVSVAAAMAAIRFVRRTTERQQMLLAANGSV